jgi:hypothetical protein
MIDSIAGVESFAAAVQRLCSGKRERRAAIKA